ncbi:MAG: imidazole glycerol phosphate synthase subunit HisF [SAR324 cluster bacterium]|nr:imidazole glycerol phosphate synthase subunit HisF [SAR324 cluster bacterium]
MLLPRVIPCLLLKKNGLVKGIQFKNHTYIGDPINAVEIFNTKEVDELFFLDITATQENRIPSLELIGQLADECLMPFSVGGGIQTIEHIKDILNHGAEKVCINTVAMKNPEFIHQASRYFGSQSIVVSVDYKKNWRGNNQLYLASGTRKNGNISLLDCVKNLEQSGVGEILLNSIDRDGTMNGYDLETLTQVCGHVTVPVIAMGGAWSNQHLKDGITAGASAVAAGSKFVFHGARRAVLINYPDEMELIEIRGS